MKIQVEDKNNLLYEANGTLLFSKYQLFACDDKLRLKNISAYKNASKAQKDYANWLASGIKKLWFNEFKSLPHNFNTSNVWDILNKHNVVYA